ncbi:MAG: glutathione S-transferase family protein [Myxococcales bacterium]|nr:glutathione S-transferase family protein [Myxococcales bacterium]
MLSLYTTRPMENGFPSMSPFCAKLEVYLQLAGIEYERRIANPRRAPHGKIPYVSLDGELIGDSQRIIERCKAKYGDRLDAKLDDAERARGRLAQRTLEEATYFGVVRARWLTDDGFAFVRGVLLDKIVPALARPLVYGKIKRDLRRTLHGQGVLRYPLAEVYQAVIDDIDAVMALKGERPFLLGDEPTSYDAVAYGFIGCLAASGYHDPAVDHARESPPVVAYCERMVARLGGASPSS